MGISNEQRTAIKRDLSAKFANASGTSRIEHGVSQWEILVDALILTIEGIIHADHLEAAGNPVGPSTKPGGELTP